MKTQVIIFLSLIVCSHVYATQLETLYGTFEIQEPLLHDLLESDCIQRLKHIHQYGIDHYLIAPDHYTRYDHSVGVMCLLRRFGASVLEQASGLAHDGTHTIFSHIGDLLFKELSPHESYQDMYFDEIMTHHGLNTILERHGHSVHDINPHNGAFRMLECELPNLCADRLEYNLQGAYLAGLLTKKHIEEILNDLRYEQGVWFFVSTKTARTFASIPLHLTVALWSNPFGMLIDHLGAQLVRVALHEQVINLDEIHKATDDEMWQRLMISTHPQVVAARTELLQASTLYRFSSKDDYDLEFRGKVRAVDPLVQIDGELIRLSELDNSFLHELEVVRKLITHKWYFKRFKL